MCCGKKRQMLDQAYNSTYEKTYYENNLQREPIKNASGVFFEYIGKTGLTAYGSMTGKRYRFNSNGMIVSVDLKDKDSLMKIPNLRLVPNS